MEPRAESTSDHLIEVLKLAGFTAGTPMEIVTSGWHMRRAWAGFSRYFENVVHYSVARVHHPQSWESFTPTAGALRGSVALLHETVGVVWYWLRETARS